METIYEWKQDRFPTTIAQRQQLNEALEQVALRALLQKEARFRMSHSLAQAAFAESIDRMVLALQLGSLNQVGISATTGEKLYAFYHPTFQEYFAAQAISDWQFFFDPAHDFPVFHASWREVILLWLGRTDVAVTEKGNSVAIAALVQLIDTLESEAIRLQVIESLGRIDPSHPVVSQCLEAILESTQQDNIRRRAAYNLGKLNPSHGRAIATLEQIIHSTTNVTLRLRTAENLITLDAQNSVASAVLNSVGKKTEKTRQRDRNKTIAQQELN